MKYCLSFLFILFTYTSNAQTRIDTCECNPARVDLVQPIDTAKAVIVPSKKKARQKILSSISKSIWLRFILDVAKLAIIKWVIK